VIHWVDLIVGKLLLNSMRGSSAATFGNHNCSVNRSNMNLIGTWYCSLPHVLCVTVYYKEMKVEERKYIIHTVY